MPQARGNKGYYNFVKGLNTEASELAFPEGSSADEENCELLIGGYRRRRYGLRLEEDHEATALEGHAEDSGWAFVEYSWRGVRGRADLNFIVQQTGPFVQFYDDNRVSFSGNNKGFTLDLRDLKVEGVADSLIASTPVAFSTLKGNLIIVGEFLEPTYLKYNEDDSTFTLEDIILRERDFEDVEDGIGLSTNPVVELDSHIYNLSNRGWRINLINTYLTDESKYPAKNMILDRGYRREIATNFNPEDGLRQFFPAKLEAELFQDVSAPKGHYLIDPFNTATAFGSMGFGGIVGPVWKIVPNPPGTTQSTPGGHRQFNTKVVLVTFKLDQDHGFSVNDEVFISGHSLNYRLVEGHGSSMSFDGPVTITGVPSLSELQFVYTMPGNFWGFFNDQWSSMGSYPSGAGNDTFKSPGFFSATREALRPQSVQTDKRPVACAAYAGRIFYAGINSERNASRIFFSQVVETPSQYGKCYQVADPTDVNISDTIDTDGGVLHIPELGAVTAMAPFQSSLLVFTQTGVWEINGGFRSSFSALNINVRRLSTAPVYAPKGITTGDSELFYAAADGAHIVRLDPRAGILVDENITEDVVQQLWADIPGVNWQYVKALHDPVRKRVWFLYSNDRDFKWRYDRALIFDTRLVAYFKYRFHSDMPYVAGAIMPRQFCCTGEPVIKFSTVTLFNIAPPSSSQFTFSEFFYRDIPITADTWTDWGHDVPAFLLTGAEVLEDASKKKQAPTIHTFMKETETGLELDTDGTYVPKNASGLFMQTRWEWADDIRAGKWSKENQIYKNDRFLALGEEVLEDNEEEVLYEDSGEVLLEDAGSLLTEASEDNVFGYVYKTGLPVVVVRNKVFGMGRALNIMFKSEPRKPFVLLGWAADFLQNMES